jgi:hypothetical protein
MALRYSKGLRNFLNEGGSIKQALAGGKILIYTGTQPASADDAVAGTLLATITLASGAHTAEVQATGSLTISGTTSGSVDSVTVNGLDILGGAVTHTGNNNTMATAVAAAINHNPKNLLYVASSTGASGVVTLTAKPGLGTSVNTHAVSATATTTTVGTFVNIGSGVAGVNQVNGLRFGDSAAGVLVKHPDQTWSGVAGATGTAGYFRFVGSVADAGSSDSSEVFIRLDGNVATSGANLNLSSTSIVTSATQTISTFSLTLPASA